MVTAPHTSLAGRMIALSSFLEGPDHSLAGSLEIVLTDDALVMHFKPSEEFAGQLQEKRIEVQVCERSYCS